MVTKTEGHILNARGQKLHTITWMPEGVPKAVLYWHHGIGEYIDRLSGAFTHFAEHGIAVFGFDAHGHGDSEPLDDKGRVFLHNYTDLIDDALLFLDDVKQKTEPLSSPPPPLFVGGNSMGGMVACHVALKRQDQLAGLLLQSPLIDVQWTAVLKVQAAVGGALASLVPYAKLVPAVKPEDMSQDPQVVEDFTNDPKIYKGNTKARTGNECLKGFKALGKHKQDFKLPIYATHGTIDRTTSLPALREFLKHVPSTDVTLKEIEGGYHELLLGPEKEDVKAAMTAWVIAHAVPKAPAAAAAPSADTAALAAAGAAAEAAAPEAKAKAAPEAEAEAPAATADAKL